MTARKKKTTKRVPDKVASHPVTGDTIAYYDAEHVYYLNDDPSKPFVSCTGLIGPHFPEFESRKIATFVARKQNRSVDEILAEWDKKRDEGATRGKKIHLIAETILKSPKDVEKVILQSDLDDKDRLFLKCLERAIPGLLERYEFIANELVVFDVESMVCGTIDLVMRCRRTGAIVFFDWKTNKKIDAKGEIGKLTQPLSHLMDCTATKYNLQLNVYRELAYRMSLYTRDTTIHLALLHLRLNPSTQAVSMKMLTCDDLTAETKALFDLRILNSPAKSPVDGGFDY